MTAVTSPQRAESHSQHVLQQALSFCRRHKQPFALLAIDLQELKTLQAEIGEHYIAPLFAQFCQQLNNRKRCEDILVTTRSNQVVFLALPGTHADGADIAAGRLLDWLNQHEFRIDEFRVTLNVRIAVHVHSGADNEGTGRLVNDTLKLLRQPAERGQRILSPQAQRQQSQQAQAQEDTQQNEANQPQALSDALLAQARKDGLLNTLTPFINALDESARLELVDAAEEPAPTRQVAALRARLVDAVAALSGARIRHHLLVRPDASMGSQVVLRFASGAPALLLSTRGRGMVALLTTAIDRDWSDLPLQPGYLPLLQEVAATLAGRSGKSRQAAIEPGGVAVLARHKEAERLVVHRTAGERPGARVREIGGAEQGGRAWQVDGLLEPGRYIAREEGKGGRWSERSILVVPPAVESDLTQLAERTLLPPDEPMAAAATRPKVPGWSFALVGLLLLLLVEGGILMRSGAPA